MNHRYKHGIAHLHSSCTSGRLHYKFVKKSSLCHDTWKSKRHLHVAHCLSAGTTGREIPLESGISTTRASQVLQSMNTVKPGKRRGGNVFYVVILSGSAVVSQTQESFFFLQTTRMHFSFQTNTFSFCSEHVSAITQILCGWSNRHNMLCRLSEQSSSWLNLVINKLSVSAPRAAARGY